MTLPLVALAIAAEPDLLQSVGTITARVSALRGDTEVPTLDVAALSEAELAALLKEAVDTDPTRGTLPAIARMCSRLGLAAAGTDLEAELRKVLLAQVAGFYDPRTRRLYVVQSTIGDNLSLQQGVLAHEIAHALDDRAWRLAELQEAHLATLDDQLVVSALLEGSATWQMLRYLFGELNAGRMTVAQLAGAQTNDERRMAGLDEASAYLNASLVAPYVVGLLWTADGQLDPTAIMNPVDAARMRLDQAARTPPASTATLLHPDEAPVSPVTVSGAWASLPATPVHEDRVGELLIAASLRGGIPTGVGAMMKLERWTSEAATGWAGDGFVVANRADGAPIDAWWTAWRSEKDRKEFTQRMARVAKDEAVDEIGERVAVFSWGLQPQEREALVASLARADWRHGGLAWSP